MIKGIGTDIVEIDRIKDAVKRHGDGFLKRIFTAREIDYCTKFNKLKFPELSVRFAAEEAYSKANGTGMVGIHWKEIEIENEKSGKPFLKVKGKKVYIPDHIEYALPSTEKQFTDGFPAGTYIKIPRDMVVGINWGQEGSRVDLDLSLISKGNKFGWDEDYRDEGRNILFSGDMTDALEPDGATELFYVKRQSKQALMLCVNYYNLGDEEGDVPIKLFIAKEAVSNMKMNYMVNPNNIVAVAKTEITKKEKILGLLITNEDESRFYFAESYVGNSITSSSISEFAQHSKQYLFDYYENAISLRDILKKSGVKFVKQDKAEIDLSPEMLEKDTIINLLNK